MIDNLLIAEVALEVSEWWDIPKKASSMPRAEWRLFIINTAIDIIKSEGITKDTEDIDEVVENYLHKEEGFGE